ncbi:hypothetical protein [Planobispora longispora]|uniref:hypothetical protein n=1 Tax=Planobispora longispora TaxID=28887 RepID=UPI00361EE455
MTTITVAPRVGLALDAAEAALALLPAGGSLEVGTPVATVPAASPRARPCAPASPAPPRERSRSSSARTSSTP